MFFKIYNQNAVIKADDFFFSHERTFVRLSARMSVGPSTFSTGLCDSSAISTTKLFHDWEEQLVCRCKSLHQLSGRLVGESTFVCKEEVLSFDEADKYRDLCNWTIYIRH